MRFRRKKGDDEEVVSGEVVGGTALSGTADFSSAVDAQPDDTVEPGAGSR